MKKISNLTASLLFIILTGCGGSSSSTNNTENLSSQTALLHKAFEGKVFLSC
ncbi:hypothetical protein ABTD34_17010 [Acinetobacter baumannii]